MQTLEQKKAWDNLNKAFDNGVITPNKFGYEPQKLKDACGYDTPGFLRNWKEDKRSVNLLNKIEDIEDDRTAEEMGGITL